MGMTEVRVRVVNLADASRFAEIESIWWPIPGTFGLAHGETVRRSVGDVRYEVGDRSGAAPVIFGRRGDASLLGVVTLEALGLRLDPLRRRLRPLRLMIA